MNLSFDADLSLRTDKYIIEFSILSSGFDALRWDCKERGIYVRQVGPFLFSITNRVKLKAWADKNLTMEVDVDG